LSDLVSAAQGGAKALGLAELARAGIDVPEAIVIPPGEIDVSPEELLARLGGCVAVRSSATVEDQADASFAGQFETRLNVTTPAGLRDAVGECRQSVNSEAVRAYAARHSIPPDAIRMAVIVQRMLKPEVAGVLFTVHPVRGDEDEMLVEMCAGLADDLLAGRVSGIRIAVREGRAVDPTPLLSAERVALLSALGRRIQRLRGMPQDIEWALEGGRFYILQARPVTRLTFTGIDGQWTNADLRDGGVGSEVVMPLTWSLYGDVLNRTLSAFAMDLKLCRVPFEGARLFFGRPYWNLGAVKQLAMRLPGFVEREFDRDLSLTPAYEGDGARTPLSLRTVARALPVLIAATRMLRRQLADNRALLARRAHTAVTGDLRALDDATLRQRLRRFVAATYRRVEDNYFRTFFCVGLVKQELRPLIEGKAVSYAKLVGGLDNLTHFACAQALWELGNHAGASLEAFLARYGHHSRRELDLRSPRWSEDPAFVTEMATHMAGAPSPAEAHRRQQDQAREERAHARALFPPWRRRSFERKLDRLRTFLWVREEMRDLSIQTYAVLRQLVLEVGRRAAARGTLERADDVFYLTIDEVDDTFARSLAAVVRSRREREALYCNFRPPDEVGRGFRLAPLEPPGQRLTGIAASAGVSTGRVCVVRNLGEAAKLTRGGVLVCAFTDPSWTPLLDLATAVVSESGGMLSHAAVICREYGIPAVLNVRAATQLLQDGQSVRVDGDGGYVDLL